MEITDAVDIFDGHFPDSRTYVPNCYIRILSDEMV
jgi:hypothetical protein